jgi:crotonobetainyl-CoA:carnitine CoA-transferase CaiB-like acyl-CoA transferase
LYDVLDGVRVLEVSMYAFVPSAGAVLADWGADVVKVVHPEYADPLASTNAIANLPDKDVGIAFMWEILNRGKRSAGIDIANPAGHAVLMRLAREADVFLTNFRAPTRRKLGIDVDDIRAVNPNIVYSRGTGQGPRGPDADSAGFDHTSFWARAGYAHAASDVVDEFIPQVGPALGDLASGFNLAAGTLAALYRRDRTGEPSVVDVSLFGTGVWMFGPSIVAAGLYDVPTIPRVRHSDLPNPLVAAYRTSDGRYIYLSGIRTDQGWQELCDHLGVPELGIDPRFADGESRLANRRECIEALDRAFALRTLDEWVSVFQTLPSAWAPVQSAKDVHSDPMAQANGYLPEVRNGAGLAYRLNASPVQFDEDLLSVRAAPGHGEHTEEVLREYGLTDEEITALRVENAVL